jgi:DNA repair exonuclease SbcCD nuclease subunit
MASINDIAVLLTKNGNRLIPINNEDISKIELEFNASLPKVYKQFLQLMGSSAGVYMQGSSVFYNELLSLKEWANELLVENNMQPLPDNAFVFWMHQGYQIAYFNLNDGDDPPVYYFTEGQANNAFELKENSLTDFFSSQLSFTY